MSNLLALAVTSRLTRHEKCKTNPITKLQASRIENRSSKILQNEPNYNTPNRKPVLSKVEWIENRISQIYSPINPFAHSHIHFFMQNEPNFNQRLVTIHQRLTTINMQNKPNSNTPNRKLKIENRKSRTIIYKPKANFCSKNDKNARILYFSVINTLNSIYNKDLHNFFAPKYPSREEFTRRLSGGKICKTNPVTIRNLSEFIPAPRERAGNQ